MRKRDRFLRLVMVVSVTAVLGAPVVASAEDPAAGDGDVCIYLQGKTDTPEIGPLPCDTSRRYMIGRSELGSSRIPADSEFSSGPKSHLDGTGSAATATESSEPAGTSASPSSEATSDRSIDTEAP
ncbi:MAG TPA: hypothetical protein VGL14_09260 [Methylomirabilota bacterium]